MGNGWRSRKLWFSVFAICMIYKGAALALTSKAFEPIYSTMVGGMVGIAGMFLVGNVSSKWVGAKGEATKRQRPAQESAQAWEESSESTPLEEESSGVKFRSVGARSRSERGLGLQRPIR